MVVRKDCLCSFVVLWESRGASCLTLSIYQDGKIPLFLQVLEEIRSTCLIIPQPDYTNTNIPTNVSVRCGLLCFLCEFWQQSVWIFCLNRWMRQASRMSLTKRLLQRSRQPRNMYDCWSRSKPRRTLSEPRIRISSPQVFFFPRY